MSLNVDTLLEELGLTINEQKIYLFLLSNGKASPTQIAKSTGIQRENTYYTLNHLQEKSLIKTIQKEGSNRKFYLAEDPELLLALHDKKRDVLVKALPDIKTLYEKRTNKPVFEFFEGVKEIQSIYLRTLSAESVLALGSTKELAKKMPEFYESFFKQLKSKNIILKDILSNPSQQEAVPLAKSILRSLYDIWVLPSQYGDLPTDILIWNNSIAIISLSEPFFGTIITHKDIADTFRIILDILHKNLDKLSTK